MFQLKNNVVNISVDEEHSVDELVELIKPYLTPSGIVGNRAQRLVYVADTCHSDDAFQLAMSLSKDLGLAVDLLRSSQNTSTTPVLIPEIITMNAAGISHIESLSGIDFPEAIIHHIDKTGNVATVLVGTSSLSAKDLGYLGSSLFNKEGKEGPMFILLADNPHTPG